MTHTLRKFGALSLSVFIITAANVAFAQEEASYEDLQELEQFIFNANADPSLQFRYAKLAEQLGQNRKARDSYVAMLDKNPQLLRVKLDLALTYARLGQFAKARMLLQEVKDTNPPAVVQANINAVISVMNEQMRTHKWTANLTGGFNYDTNGNSAASSGAITFLDQSVNLDNNNQAQSDHQIYAAISAEHNYRMKTEDPNYAYFWRTNLTGYGTYQRNFKNIELALGTVKTGPRMVFHDLDLTLDLQAGYSHIELDDHEYLNLRTYDMAALYNLNDDWQLSATLTHEDRDFSNSPTVTTHTDRTGDAQQLRVSARYLASTKDIITVGGLWRDENTRQQFYNFDTLGVNASYTRVLPWNSFALLSTTYQMDEYDGADPLVSTRVREDHKSTMGVTFGKSLDLGVTATAGYLYTKSDSNIQNFEYDNHRVSFALSKAF